MKFPCTRCGLCCQKIGEIEMLKEFDRGDGVCRYFDHDLGCKIYESRPVCCKIDEGYRVFAQHLMGPKEYMQRNADICNSMQAEAGLESKYKVEL